MRILIASDTHGKDEVLKEVIDKEAPFDMLIHLGDTVGSEKKIAQMLSVRTAFLTVKGNNDFANTLDEKKEVRLGKYKALLVHGHRHGVYAGTQHLRNEALSKGYDIVMYGHTHVPHYENKDGIIILNPGSISYPRQRGNTGTYMIMDIDASDTINTVLKFLDEEKTVIDLSK
jgi:phosphodiesterase family protein